MGRDLLSVLFPPVCPVCERTMPAAHAGRLCEKCKDKVKTVTNNCLKCGRPLNDSDTALCAECKNNTFPFKKGFITFLYEGSIRDMLLKFKYKDRRDLGLFFSNASTDMFGDELKSLAPDAIIPIPVHKKRLRQRGYNQAEVFGEYVACELGIPCAADILIRTKETTVQKSLDVHARLLNLLDAFAVDTDELAAFEKKNGPVKRAVLVDDIFTTGSTLCACSLVLRDAGIDEIYVLCVASPGM